MPADEFTDQQPAPRSARSQSEPANVTTNPAFVHDAQAAGISAHPFAPKGSLIHKIERKASETTAKEGERRLPGITPKWLWDRPCGRTWHNSILYRVPLFNLVVPLLSSETETTAWPQLQNFLETVTLVSALMLSLAITAGTAVTFEELTATNVRFSRGIEPSQGFWNFSNTFSSVDSETGESVQVAGDPLQVLGGVGGPLTTPWDRTFNEETGELVTKVRVAGDNSFPCYNDRQIDKDQTWVSGNYARWYWTGGTGEAFEGSDPINVYSVVQNYARYTIWSTSCFCCVVTIALLLLATGAPNVFARQSDVEQNTISYQYRKIMHMYLFWNNWALIICLILLGTGFVTFIQQLKFIMYIKFPDDTISNLQSARMEDFIAHTSDGLAWFGPRITAEYTYKFLEKAQVWGWWGPFGVVFLLASKAQHAAYTFPIKPPRQIEYGSRETYGSTVTCNAAGVSKETKYREFRREEFAIALRQAGLLEAFDGDNMEYKGPYLSVAGGVPTSELWSVIDALMDQGIDGIDKLYDILELNKSALFEIKGIQMGAVLKLCKAFKTDKDGKRYIEKFNFEKWQAIEEKTHDAINKNISPEDML